MYMSSKDEDILIGVGVLDWRKHERVGDRYGSFCLFKDSMFEETIRSSIIICLDLARYILKFSKVSYIRDMVQKK